MSEILDSPRVRVIDGNTVEVNLGLAPKLPFSMKKVEWHSGEGWVTVQKRSHSLYVGGKMVYLHRSHLLRSNQFIIGHQLREELVGKKVLNVNILDALLEHTHLIPEDWKHAVVFFWGSGFRNMRNTLCAPYFVWVDNEWLSSCYQLDLALISSFPAALIE